MALIVIEVVTSPSGRSVEQGLHVLDRADGHADPADLPGGLRRVRVVAHLGGQVEGDRQAGLALLEQVAEPLVGLGRGREAGVLAHRPEAAAVHRRLDAARERELARAARGRGPRRGRRCRRACRGRRSRCRRSSRNVSRRSAWRLDGARRASSHASARGRDRSGSVIDRQLRVSELVRRCSTACRPRSTRRSSADDRPGTRVSGPRSPSSSPRWPAAAGRPRRYHPRLDPDRARPARDARPDDARARDGRRAPGARRPARAGRARALGLDGHLE